MSLYNQLFDPETLAAIQAAKANGMYYLVRPVQDRATNPQRTVNAATALVAVTATLERQPQLRCEDLWTLYPGQGIFGRVSIVRAYIDMIRGVAEQTGVPEQQLFAEPTFAIQGGQGSPIAFTAPQIPEELRAEGEAARAAAVRRCYDAQGRNLCPDDQWCDAESGQCITPTTALGRVGPNSRDDARLRRLYGEEYSQIPEERLLGRRETITRLRELQPVRPGRSPRQRGGGKGKERNLPCDNPNAEPCPPGQVCRIDTGQCGPNPYDPALSQLAIGDRVFVGSGADVRELQNRLGGTVSRPSREVERALRESEQRASEELPIQSARRSAAETAQLRQIAEEENIGARPEQGSQVAQAPPTATPREIPTSMQVPGGTIDQQQQALVDRFTSCLETRMAAAAAAAG